MKTIAFLLFLSVSTLAFAQSAEPWAIKGTVISATDEGVIVMVHNDSAFGRPKPTDGAVVFVRGLELADDDPVNVEAIPDGVFKYTSAIGAQKTVRAFRMKE